MILVPAGGGIVPTTDLKREILDGVWRVSHHPVTLERADKPGCRATGSELMTLDEHICRGSGSFLVGTNENFKVRDISICPNTIHSSHTHSDTQNGPVRGAQPSHDRPEQPE